LKMLQCVLPRRKTCSLRTKNSRSRVLLARRQAKRTGNPAKLRQSRVILELIIMWEIFSCLSTGKEPDLHFPNGLSTQSIPASAECAPSLSSWYLAFAPAPGTPRVGSGDGDWETVEGLLGISRGLVEILHRVSRAFHPSRLNFAHKLIESYFGLISLRRLTRSMPAPGRPAGQRSSRRQTTHPRSTPFTSQKLMRSSQRPRSGSRPSPRRSRMTT
jgi:hypothetical protein